MMKYLLLAAVFFQSAYSKCPNACNGHGTCNIHDQCTCFNEEADGVEYLASDETIGAICFKHKTADPCGKEKAVDKYRCKYDPNAVNEKGETGECKRIVKNKIIDPTTKRYSEWQGADCSRRTCPRSTSWTTLGPDEVDPDDKTVPKKSLGYVCTHKVQVECSDQGSCDRATGLCDCYPGFTGNACQRTECPDDCSGHGTCRSNRDFAYDFAIKKSHQLLQTDLATELFQENYLVTYENAWDSNHLYGCLCDRGYRGANCAMVECPSSNDPLDDKCWEEENYLAVENFQIQKFAATGSLGWREAYADSTAKEQKPDLCNTPANIADATGKKCEAIKGPNPATDRCKFYPAKTKPQVAPARCEQVGLWTLHATGDKNNHFYNGKVYSCFGAMAGMDCSGRGICDYSTGQCSCFSGYSGTSCSKIEELV